MCTDCFCRCLEAEPHTADLSLRRNGAAAAETDDECLMVHIANIKRTPKVLKQPLSGGLFFIIYLFLLKPE